MTQTATLAETDADSEPQPTDDRRRPWLSLSPSLSLPLRASFAAVALLSLSLLLAVTVAVSAEAADPAAPPDPLWRCESGRQLFPNSSWCCPPPLSQSAYGDALAAVRLLPPSVCVLRGSCATSSHSPCGDAFDCCQGDWACVSGVNGSAQAEGGGGGGGYEGGRACRSFGIYFAPRSAFAVSQSSGATPARDLAMQCSAALSPCRHNGTCAPDYERAQCACADGVAFAQPNCSFACPVGSRCEAPESLQSAVYTAEECEPGSFCAPPPDPELSSPPAQPCPAGSYCPARSAAPTRCEAGNYCPAANMSAPLPCPAGQYCAAGCEQPITPVFACPPGRAMTKWTAAVPSLCCDENSFTTNDAGRCRDNLGSDTTANAAPAAEVSAHCIPSPCNHGTPCTATFLNFTCSCPRGFVGPRCDFQCPAGSLCANAPADNSTAFDSSLCPTGFYCPLSALIPTPAPLLCPRGAVCPMGSPVPADCGTGHYCPDMGMAVPTPCPGGLVCTSLNATSPGALCPPGQVCQSGQPPALCPVGFYCPDRGMNASLPCPSGQYCPPGCVQPFVPFFVCVEAGRALTSWTASSPSVCCPLGSFSDGRRCLGGSNGWLSDTTASAVPAVEVSAHCMPSPCRHGTLCTPTLLNFTCSCPRGFIGPRCDFQCPAGSLCGKAPADNSTAFDSSPCPTGFYCPLSALIPSPTPLLCPRGSICPMGSAAPALCPAGGYCPNTGMSASWSCPVSRVCPLGSAEPFVGTFICPPGTGPLVRPTQWTTEFPRCCPSGQSFDSTNCQEQRCATASDTRCSSRSESCCRGKYCNYSYCTSSKGSKISDFTSTYGWHPSDSSKWPLSIEVSANCRPNPCRHNGTCTPTISAFECDCGGDPAFAPQLNCAFACPPGRACSSRPLDNSTAYDSAPCPAGWFCSNVDGAIPTQPERCSGRGFHCPEGSDRPALCPPGFMCRDPLTAAVPCTAAGSVCMGGNATAVDCPAGFFCGSGHNQTVECPVSHYCPVRSEAPLPCPAGFLGSETQLSHSNCSGICPAGEFCPVGTGWSVRCNWCPAGSAVMAPCPRDYQCDPSRGTLAPCGDGRTSPLGASDCQKPACPPLQKREGPGDEGGCQLAPGGIALIVCMGLLGVLVVSTLLWRRRRRLRAAMEERNKRTHVNPHLVGARAAGAGGANGNGNGNENGNRNGNGNGGGGAAVVHVSEPGGVGGGVDIALRSPSRAIAAAPPQLQMAPLPAANSNSNSNWNSNRVSPSAHAQAHGRPLVPAFAPGRPQPLPLPTVAAAPVNSGIGGFAFAAPVAPAAAAAAASPVVRYHPEPQPATFARAPCTAADMPAFGSSGAEGEPRNATGPPAGPSAHGHPLGHDGDLATPPPYSSIAVGSVAGAPQGTEGQQSDIAVPPSFCTSCGFALLPLESASLRFCCACGARLAS